MMVWVCMGLACYGWGKKESRRSGEPAVTDIGPVSHVRLNIFPDGGLSRLRLYGTIGGG